MNIYEKLLKITEELGVVAKNLEVGKGASKYNAVGEADVLAAVKPLEVKHGIYSYPVKREVISQERYEETKPGYKPTDPPQVKQNFFMRVETTYRFVNISEPKEYIDVISYGDGIDSRDKAPGKAMTYADKYALLKAYKIMTGDDPDQNHSNNYESGSTSNNYKNEKEAKDTETAKGLAKIMGKLNNDDNKDYRPTVISTICNERKVDKWGAITFDDKFSYKDLVNRVSEILKKEKELANAGI